ncbi:serine/threonine-protein kinase [Jatrophihabitans fulvus]
MPETFGRYELRGLIGRGGMGEVHRAYDTVRDREVALKLLPAHLAGDESFTTRFRREARIAARLSDPHIIPIHDFGEIDGRLFLDMRLVRGKDLSDLLADRGRLPADLAVGILGQVASALDAAHESGLIHRDVKPSNVLLTGFGGTGRTDADDTPFAYLVDFGIARATSSEGTQLTSTTTTLGTAAYLAPERIGGQVGDRRVDVYALACMTYELLTGRKPFEGELFAIMYGHVNQPPPSLLQELPGCPPGLDAAVRRGMAKDPDQRYPTAGEFVRDLRTALRVAAVPLAPPPVPQPPRNEPTPVPPLEIPGRRPGSVPPRTAPAPADAGPDVEPPTRAGHAAGVDPRPAPPSRPLFGPATEHRSTPAPLPLRPDTGSRSGRRKRGFAVAAAVAVAVVVAAVVAALSLGGDDSPSAGPNPSSSVRTTGSQGGDFPSDGASTSLHTGTGTTADWADYRSFSQLVGTSDGDTGHAYGKADCRLFVPGDAATVGYVSAIKCTLPGSTTTFGLSRYRTAELAQARVRALAQRRYALTSWAVSGSDSPRGLTYTAPQGAAADVVSTVCGLPTYLVRFGNGLAGPSAADVAGLWRDAAFPDAVPPACSSDFSGSSGPALQGSAQAKTTAPLTGAAAEALLRGTGAGVQVSSVPIRGGSDLAAYDQKGAITFYTSGRSGLVRVGASRYPYDTSLGASPDASVTSAALLTGMSHATFVVKGVFSGDSSGNAVAFAYSPQAGWGVVKAESNGNLAPSGEPVGDNRIGLAYDFGLSGGQLVTTDCSERAAIAECGRPGNQIVKYWRWTGSDFALARREGPSR